jgi:hypothetical protein
MAQGGVFNLVLRDERYDRWFTASELLRERLDKERARRAAIPAAERPPGFSVQPPPAELEKTHTFFLRRSFRPYVAVASEYARVLPAAGLPTALGPGGALTFALPTFGHFTSDLVLHVRFGAVGDAAAAAAGAAPTPAAPLYAWAALPGLRFADQVRLESDGVLFDEYSALEAAQRAKFFVTTDHARGFEAACGQQPVRQAVWQGNGYEGVLEYRDGPQTPQLYQPAFEAFVPLDFWFCRGAAHALVNDLVANTQRRVVVRFPQLRDLLRAYVRADSDVILQDPDPAAGPAPPGLAEVPLPAGLSVAYSAALYVNGLFVNPEVHDVFASRADVTLARVHRAQTTPLIAARQRTLMSQLKFASEYFLVGVRARANAADISRWWLMGAAVPRPPAARLYVPAVVWGPLLPALSLVNRQAADVSALENPLAALRVDAHDVVLYAETGAKFFGAYLPIRYPERSVVVSPVDPAAFLVPFCLMPGAAEPSGHYNLSAGRELYLETVLRDSFLQYDLSLVVYSSALNFLVRRGDKFELRYAL